MFWDNVAGIYDIFEKVINKKQIKICAYIIKVKFHVQLPLQ